VTLTRVTIERNWIDLLQVSSVQFSSRAVNQPLAGTLSYEPEDFVGPKYCCPHALADGNQCIQSINQSTLFQTNKQ